jgi:hypothetical protein
MVTSSSMMPQPTQKLPQAVCTATATPSRARKLAIAAIDCIIPPANMANGQMMTGVSAVPYQPACQAPSINVAIMKPNRPMIDGAAIGSRTTLLRASHA